MRLSKRLLAVASMVTPGMKIADIGTDHACLPIYLVGEGICPSAVASDIRTGPLERARRNVIEAGLSESIELILSDGMSALTGVVPDAVVISGMGGERICGILRASEILKDLKELILSPHSECDKVRECVLENGFDITREKMICDAGKYYLILKAVRVSAADAGIRNRSRKNETQKTDHRETEHQKTDHSKTERQEPDYQETNKQDTKTRKAARKKADHNTPGCEEAPLSVPGCGCESYSGFDLMFGKKMFESRDPVFYEFLRKKRDRYAKLGRELPENERIAKTLSLYNEAVEKFETYSG